MAFATLKYLGAAYLVYLGVRRLLGRGGADHPEIARREPLRRLYAHGAVVATLNPKTALFFLAFLPQFVDPAAGPVSVQICFLGVLLVAITTVSDSLYALLAGTAGAWLRGTAAARRAQRVVSGGVYIALGLSAAVAGARSTSK